MRRLRSALVLSALAGALAAALAVVVPVIATERSNRAHSTSAKPTASSAARGRRGPRGLRGPRGYRGPAGADATDVVRPFTINWRNGAFAGRDSATAAIPSIGNLTAVCNLDRQALVIDPTAGPGVRTIANVTSYEGEGIANAFNDRLPHDPGARQIVIPLPVNGMLSVTLSTEPVSGDGGPGVAPATLLVSSERKVNDPTAGLNFCYVAGQALQG
jgi:hypothetical protein